MNLIERARQSAKTAGSIGGLTPIDERALFGELAGEVERLWDFERHMKDVEVPGWRAEYGLLQERLKKIEAESAAEIELLKNSVDTAALQKAWFDGYRAAAGALNGVVAVLLGAGVT